MQVKNQDVINAELNKDIGFIKQNIVEINEKLDKKYVSREEFEPVKKIVYGLVTVVLTSFLLGIIAIVSQHAK